MTVRLFRCSNAPASQADQATKEAWLYSAALSRGLGANQACS